MQNSLQTVYGETGEYQPVPSVAVRTLVSKDEGAPADCSLAVVEPGGGSPDPEHVHPHDHIFFVLEGDALIKVGKESRILSDCQAMHVRGREPHTVTNIGEEELRILALNI